MYIMEFKTVCNHSLYEINKFGEVRKIKTQKLMYCIDAKLKLVNDQGKRTMRSIQQLVQSTFFPELGNKRGAIRFVEDVGYMIDKNGYNNDDSLIGKLVSFDCDYKIYAKKNYKDEVRFQFIGLLNEDQDMKCLIYNEEDETTKLFKSVEEGEAEKMNGDELYYFSVYEGKDDMSNVDLLEHVLNAKFFYIRSKIDEYDIDIDEGALYKKYLKYDFEERYDEWSEELQIEKYNKQVKQKVKVTNRGIPFLTPMPEEHREEYEKEKKIELAKKHERLRILEEQQQQEEERKKRTLLLEDDAFCRAVDSQVRQTIKRHNKVFGTNFADMDALVRQFKNEKRIKEQRQAAAVRQKDKDEKTKKKLEEKLKILN